MDDLENYAEYGHSSILYLLLEVLGINNDQIQIAASHLGVSSGIVTLLRGYAHHAQQVSRLRIVGRIVLYYILLSFSRLRALVICHVKYE